MPSSISFLRTRILTVNIPPFEKYSLLSCNKPSPQSRFFSAYLPRRFFSLTSRDPIVAQRPLVLPLDPSVTSRATPSAAPFTPTTPASALPTVHPEGALLFHLPLRLYRRSVSNDYSYSSAAPSTTTTPRPFATHSLWEIRL